MTTKICIITTGGTIDKVYFDENSEFEVGSPIIKQILAEAKVKLDYYVKPLLRKDSLEITSEDRALILETVENCDEELILLTHGTDTMTQTGEYLSKVENKTIVLTGALTPARFRSTDAIFNIGLALGALQCKPHGVYITMNGQIFEAGKVRKNLAKQQFEKF